MPKAIHLLVNEMLPEDLRSNDRTYTKGEINDLVGEVARRDPDKYAKLVDQLKDLGRTSVYLQGATLRLSDFEPAFNKQVILDQMDQELAQLDNIKNVKERKNKRLEIYSRYTDVFTDLAMETGRNSGSSLAGVIASGARGNPTQYRAMIATPGLYTDYKDEPIDMFVRRSFGEGVRPIDFLASTFGTRKSVLSTKNATADAGDFSKMLEQNTRNLTVTQKNSLTDNAILLDPEEDSLRGRVLARDVAGFKRGTAVDRHVENKIRNSGVKRVMVFSPLSDLQAEGLSGEAFGVNYNLRVPGPGFAAGPTSSTAIGEPIAQGSLNTKHTGGAFGGGKREFSGFDYISQFVQVPDSFKDRAAVSEVEGRVEKIEAAEQGGQYVTVEGERHYVLPGFEVTVKPGDTVEPGDRLSEGLINPKDIIRLRGLGEGRRYYSRRLKRLLDDSGQAANLRDTEVVARGALDAVQITDPNGYNGILPDTITSYNKIASDWKPRKGSELLKVPQAKGRYLEQPALHYTIGTKLTNRMLEELQEAGLEDVFTHTEPAPFEPLQVRLRTSSFEANDDWLARTGTSYLQKNLAESAQRGYDTNIESNINPFPRLSVGKDFGEEADKTGRF
jgi:DNA-directed RNA polymerase subunit beta'